jgi:hypothetical protein
MTTLLDDAIAKVRKLPEADQDLAAEMLLAVVERRGRNRTRLTPEQLAEVERLEADLASGKEDFMTDEELAALRQQFGA